MPIVAIDLFCGIGGLTKGLELAGINVIAGIDIEDSCKYAYESNNNAHFMNWDITQISSDKINDLYPKDCIKILAGCAPCQPFSKYTHRYRKDGYRDEKWRLLYYFSKIITEINPEIVAMENVPELANTTVFIDFISKLKQLDYFVQHQIVYCPDYGVPQNRKRLILLASKLGDINLIPPTHTPENYLTVRDAIGDLPPISAGETCVDDIMHQSTSLSKKNLKRIKFSVQGGTWKDWPIELQLKCHKKNSGKTYPSVYGRMFWDKPSPTITTQFYGYGNGRFGHPEQDRALSLREGAILQSFPRNYTFIDNLQKFNKRQLGIQIGNAVPVELGKAIGISIMNHIGGKNNEKKET